MCVSRKGSRLAKSSARVTGEMRVGVAHGGVVGAKATSVSCSSEPPQRGLSPSGMNVSPPPPPPPPPQWFTSSSPWSSSSSSIPTRRSQFSAALPLGQSSAAFASLTGVVGAESGSSVACVDHIESLVVFAGGAAVDHRVLVYTAGNGANACRRLPTAATDEAADVSDEDGGDGRGACRGGSVVGGACLSSSSRKGERRSICGGVCGANSKECAFSSRRLQFSRSNLADASSKLLTSSGSGAFDTAGEIAVVAATPAEERRRKGAAAPVLVPVVLVVASAVGGLRLTGGGDAQRKHLAGGGVGLAGGVVGGGGGSTESSGRGEPG
mmetsp:Transcript_14719/g.48270  ORF Transcript_14719/g.48270 Transcript_14719/m.48270 type:complete len:325 (+) Transcript_14719:933-1907(+)